ncbi:MAG: uroporphyrinogen decarboxylase family protein [Bacteroidota bacterium]|nr:uroporphyrinogen decarboxylase family protein [Bacteroidota bacterium]
MIAPRKYPADFHQLEKVLCRQTPDRPVLFEYFVNGDLISFVNDESFSSLNNPIDQIKSIIRFFYAAGYDYATIPSRYFDTFSFETAGHEKKETVSLNDGAVITDRKSFESYNWPDPEKGNFELLLKSASFLNDGMKLIIPGPGGLLENVIELVGFENLCFMIYEDEELTKEIFDAVGSRLLRFYEICSSVAPVGALIVNDDWGFKTQTMLSPETLRQHVFPWHKRMVEAIHRNSKYAILHSCGNLTDVIDDIVEDLKYDAKHSFEDTILPIEKAWELWHDRIAIMGGIDMDFLVRGEPEKIKVRCRKMLAMTGSTAYALGSGNSIPAYVPIENYLAMIEVVNE